MKKTNMRMTAVRMGENMVRADALRERLYMASVCGGDELLRRLGAPADGLTEALAAVRARSTAKTCSLTAKRTAQPGGWRPPL